MILHLHAHKFKGVFEIDFFIFREIEIEGVFEIEISTIDLFIFVKLPSI